MCQTSVAESADFGMNTEIVHKVFGENSQEALIFSKDELPRLENRLSRFISGSEVSRINESAGVKPVKISNENYYVLSNAIRFSEISYKGTEKILSVHRMYPYKHYMKGASTMVGIEWYLFMNE